jgi:putative ABC transport system permease protein
MSIGIFGTVRPLTIEDAQAIERLPMVEMTDPALSGNAEVNAAGRTRRVMVVGVGANFAPAFKLRVPVGRFLPQEDPRQARALAVVGAKVRQELFGDQSPLGSRIEIGGIATASSARRGGQVLGMIRRCRVHTGGALSCSTAKG